MKQNQKTLRQFYLGEKSIRRTGTSDIKQMPLAWSSPGGELLATPSGLHRLHRILQAQEFTVGTEQLV